MGKKRPTHTVRLASKYVGAAGRSYSTVGVAWLGPAGMLSVQLNPGVVLDWRISEDYFINVIPNSPVTADTSSREAPPAAEEEGGVPCYGDDEIPF